jgi:phage tail-like protein
MDVPYRAQLTIRLAGTVTQTVALTAPVLTIGRLPDNDLVLAMPMVSGRHAELRLDAEGAVLTDLGSRNGTFVGELRLPPNQPLPLAPGSVFRIYPFELAYEELDRVGEERSTLSVDLEQVGATAAEPVSAGSPPTIQAAIAPGLETPAPSPAEPEPPLQPTRETPPPLPPAEMEPPLPPVVVVPPNGAITHDGQALLAPPPPARVAFPPTGAPGPYSSYLDHLPVIFQNEDFLGRLLLVVESLWEPLEQRQDHIAMYFDPRTCPVSFLPWLARWLDIPINRHWPEARIRGLVAEATHLYSWRGTRYGLTRMIEVCTGISPVITESPEEPFTFQIRMHIPTGSDVDRDLVEQLILAHKPAHVGYYLDVGS